MYHAQIIRNGKTLSVTKEPKVDTFACAKWAHLMGWNVDSFNDKGGRLSSDCGKRKATLKIFPIMHPEDIDP